MKKILVAAASVATLAIAGTASAQAVNQQVEINASVAKKCGISAQSTTVTLGDLTDSAARIRAGVTDEIATALNGARIVPFCNHANATVNVERAVLAAQGSTGNSLAQGGFAQFVRYNLDASINNLPLDSTSNAGGSVVPQAFGGHISLSDPNTHIKFVTAATAGTAVASSNGSSPTATNWSSLTDRRLIAGTYQGHVNVTLTPGA